MRNNRTPSKKTYDAVESAIESSKALRGTWDELARNSNIDLWEAETFQSVNEPPHRQSQHQTEAQVEP
jgi:hypothetical protein